MCQNFYKTGSKAALKTGLGEISVLRTALKESTIDINKKNSVLLLVCFSVLVLYETW